MAKIHTPGLFPAVVVEHGWSESKNGTPSLTVAFQTDEGMIRGWFYMTDKAAQHTIKKIRAMGYTGDDLRELGNGMCIRGNACVIEIQHEVGQDGQQRDRVAFVHPVGYKPGNGGVKNSDAAAANVARFNALLKKEPTVAPAGSSATGEVSEVPFS